MTVETRDPLTSHAGPWSEQEWLALPQDGVRIELLDGSLLVSPNAARPHQQISRLLANVLDEPVERLGGEVVEGANLRLRSGRVMIPDLTVFYEPDVQAITDCDHARVVVEIISPGQADRDRILKSDLYAAAKIPWYLIVEAEKGSIELGLYRLAGGRYEEEAVGRNGEEFHLEPLDFSFDPDVVLPRTLR